MVFAREWDFPHAHGTPKVAENPDFRNLAETLLPRSRVESKVPGVVVPVPYRVTVSCRSAGAVWQQMAASTTTSGSRNAASTGA